MPGRTPWVGRIEAVSIAAAAPFLVVLFILSVPFMLPFVAITERRARTRRHALARTSPSGWCVAPIRIEALARADALFDAYARDAFSRRTGERFRVVRTLHACRPRCDAGHRHDESTNQFVLLHTCEFERIFGPALRDVVPPATATMAWPWLAPPGAMHDVALTRDSVPLADDGDAPQGGSLTVPAAADVVAIAEALLRSPWLARVSAATRHGGVRPAR